MTDAERRFTSVRVELRASADDKMTIGGYAAKFNRMSQNLGGFVERIDSTFFNKSRGDGGPNVVARFNHEDAMMLGRSDSGSLRLGVDDVGLTYEVDLLPSRVGIYEMVQRGDITQSSFAFIAYEDDWTTNDQGYPLRTLQSGKLLDVAPVVTPAYEDTSVGALRSLARKFDAPVEEVRALVASDPMDGLKKFFRRTDDTGKPVQTKRSAADALTRVMRLDPDQTL